jgi:hypothetical protein
LAEYGTLMTRDIAATVARSRRRATEKRRTIITVSSLVSMQTARATDKGEKLVW